MFSCPGGRNIKYEIAESFLNFRFRIIYKYLSAVEAGIFVYLRSIVERDYLTFNGKMPERYFKEKQAGLQRYSENGIWCEKGDRIELVMVGIDDFSKSVLFTEVKRRIENIIIPALKEKS